MALVFELLFMTVGTHFGELCAKGHTWTQKAFAGCEQDFGDPGDPNFLGVAKHVGGRRKLTISLSLLVIM